jgi:hypothetical protein
VLYDHLLDSQALQDRILVFDPEEAHFFYALYKKNMLLISKNNCSHFSWILHWLPQKGGTYDKERKL